MIRECVLKVGVIGINHKIANLSFRESFARGASSLAGEKAVFFPHPVLLLSTCNRTEIYFGGDDLAAIHGDLLEWLRGYMEECFEHRLYSYFGTDCFVHIAQVTAGLDSAILAETEIQAQVKSAYASACRFAKFPACLHYVFQKALKIGKMVRGQMGSHMAPSLFQAIWQMGREHLPKEPRILLVGYSEINRRMAYFLRQRGMEQISWITQGCVEGSFGYEEIDRWPMYDWIICASGKDRFLIQGAPRNRHVIFDLSVPRNVDPKLGESEGVLLYNIEQINEWIQGVKSKSGEQVTLLNEMIRREVVHLAGIYKTKTQCALGISGTV